MRGFSSNFLPLLFSIVFLLFGTIQGHLPEAEGKNSKTELKAIEADGEFCECGKYLRNRNKTVNIGTSIYDTLVPLGSGSDSNVEHAFSPELGHCVAIKRCSEQIWLNKCTREMHVLRALNGSGQFINIFNYKEELGQKCTEESLFSDYLRMIVVGSDKKRRRRKRLNWDLNTELDNCTMVTTVLELGTESAGAKWRRMNSKKGGENAQNSQKQQLEQIRLQVDEQLGHLHGLGLAHRDVHPDNVLLFHSNQNANISLDDSKFHAKLIDFGWTCCFDSTKCGPELTEILPQCPPAEGLADDRFGAQDLLKELQKL